MIERIKQVVAQMLSGIAKTGIGNVWDYDPDTYAVRVQLQPSGVVTGWMPIASHWVGSGFGMVAGPGIGDMVRVDFIDGNFQAALMGARYFSDAAPPPAVPSGECWLVHSSGSLVKLHNDGSVEIHSAGNLNASAGGNLSATVGGNLSATVSGSATAAAASWAITGDTVLTGNLVVSGAISDQGGAKGTLQHIRDNYNTHTHTDPQGGTTGTPSNTL